MQDDGEQQRAVRIRTGVIDHVGDMDEDAALAALDRMAAAWGVGAGDSPAQRLQRAMDNFRVQPDAATTARRIADQCQEVETEAVALFQRLRTLGVYKRDQHGAELLARTEAVLHQIFHGKTVALSLAQACAPPRPEEGDLGDQALDARLAAWGVKFRWRATVGGEELVPVQEIIMYLLDVATRYGFRRHGTDIFEPVFVDNHNTRAFQRLYGVQDFVYDTRFTGKDFNYDMFLKLTAGAQNAKAVISYLEKANDSQLPVLDRDRTVFSFTDGMYFARTDRFVPYADLTDLPQDVVAAKFFAQPFDSQVARQDWRDIPTPELDSILEYQEMPTEVINWFYVLMGRMIYSLSDAMDSWQVLPFLFGAAGYVPTATRVATSPVLTL